MTRGTNIIISLKLGIIKGTLYFCILSQIYSRHFSFDFENQCVQVLFAYLLKYDTRQKKKRVPELK